MVMKTHNYHRLLTDYINANLNRPFEWGKCDCVTFAIGAIEAMIGREVEKPDLTYSTREQAIEFSKVWSLEAGMREQLGAYDIQRNFHQPGDIAIVRRDNLERTLVVFDRRAYAPEFNGVVTVYKVQDLYNACSEAELKILRFD